MSTHSALRGCEYFFCPRGSHFAALVSYHTYVSQCPSPISSPHNELHAPAHLSSSVEQLRYSEQFTSGEAQALFQYCREREEAAHKYFQKHHLVLCLQVVTTVCNFNILPRLLKGWKGRRGTQSSPRLLSPSLANLQASQRSWNISRQNLVIQKYSYSNPETS